MTPAWIECDFFDQIGKFIIRARGSAVQQSGGVTGVGSVNAETRTLTSHVCLKRGPTGHGQSHARNADYDSAGSVIQQIANLDAEKANLTALYQNYVASNTPAPPEVLTSEELQNRPWWKLSAEQALQIATEGSKYGKNLTYADPNVQAGWREAQRRRSSGE